VRASIDHGRITSDRGSSWLWAELILVCQPGGFDKFFEEIGREMENVSLAEAHTKMGEVTPKYRMEMLGPPLLKPLRPR